MYQDYFTVRFLQLPFEIREIILSHLTTLELLYYIVHAVQSDCNMDSPKGADYTWLSHLFSSLLWRNREVSRWDLAIVRQAIRLRKLPKELKEHLNQCVDRLNFSNIKDSNVTSALQPILDFKRIRDLDLSGCLILDEFTLESVLLSQPQLIKLNLSKMPSLSDQLLILLPTRLQSLDISYNPRVTDAGLLRYLNKIDTLQSLNLSACNRISNWPLILKIITETQPCITSLTLSKNDGININTLFQWLSDCSLTSNSSLSTLDIRDCIDFTKSDVRQLAGILKGTNILHNALMEDYSSSSIAQYVRYISGMAINTERLGSQHA